MRENQLRHETARLKASGSHSEKATLIEKYKDDSKFLQYIELHLGSNHPLSKQKAVKESSIFSPDKNKKQDVESDEDEGIEEDSNKFSKKSISDREVFGQISSLLNSIRE